MLEKLKALDTRLFLYLNSKHTPFWDVIMYWASDKLIWIPFYAFLLFIVIKHFKKKSILVIISIALLITLSDQIASDLLKNTVKRLRPSHEAALQNLVHLSAAGAGGNYGFVSSHASNAFTLFTFLSMVLPAAYRPLKYVLLCWAVLVSYSRIYNGVHYPGDVICGGIIGALLGWLIAKLYFYLAQKNFKATNFRI